MTVILGIDPGYDRVGVAVINKHPHSDELILSDCLTTNRQTEETERLKKIGDAVSQLIDHYRPEILAIENVFFNKNQKTALRVAETKGVIIYLAMSAGLKVYEFTPLQIKIAVTGYGRSDKKQITSILPQLIRINKTIKFDDEYDAIAAALTGSAVCKK